MGLNHRFKTFNCIFVVVLVILVSPCARAEDPLQRCRFVFSDHRSAVLKNIKKVNSVIQWNWLVTGRALDEYHEILSENNRTEFGNTNLKEFIFRPRKKFRWWDSGGGQGLAIREGFERLKALGQDSLLVVNSLRRPWISYLRWPKSILYFNGVRSEDFSKQYVEAFDLITEVFGPGGTYAVDAVGVFNSYLSAMAVGGRLVMSTSFRSQVLVGNKTVALAKWLEIQLRKSPDYKIYVTRNHTVWVEKLRSTNFRLNELDLNTYTSADELYRGYIDFHSDHLYGNLTE